MKYLACIFLLCLSVAAHAENDVKKKVSVASELRGRLAESVFKISRDRLKAEVEVKLCGDNELASEIVTRQPDLIGFMTQATKIIVDFGHMKDLYSNLSVAEIVTVMDSVRGMLESYAQGYYDASKEGFDKSNCDSILLDARNTYVNQKDSDK